YDHDSVLPYIFCRDWTIRSQIYAVHVATLPFCRSSCRCWSCYASGDPFQGGNTMGISAHNSAIVCDCYILDAGICLNLHQNKYKNNRNPMDQPEYTGWIETGS